MSRCYFIFIIFLSALATSIAQSFKPIEDGAKEILQDAIVLDNSSVAMVGYYSKDSKEKAFIRIVNNENKESVEKLNITKENCRINALVQNGNSDLILVGYKMSNKKKVGWLVVTDSLGKAKYDKKGDKLEATFAGTEFLKVVRTQKNTIVIAGKNAEANKGDLYFYTYNQKLNNILAKNTDNEGAGVVADLKSMEMGDNNTIWLCGNRQGEPNIWIGKSKEGQDLEFTNILPTSYERKLYCSTVNIYGELLTAGELTGFNNVEAYISSVKNGKEEIIKEVKYKYLYAENHKIKAICQGLNDTIWIADQVEGWEDIVIAADSAKSFTFFKSKTKVPAKVEILKILMTEPNHYVIVGVEEGKAYLKRFSDASFKHHNTARLSEKGLEPDIEANISHNDSDGNGVINHADTYLMIDVLLKNSSPYSISDCKIRVKNTNFKRGVGKSLTRTWRTVEPLAIGKQTRNSISFEIDIDGAILENGQNSITFEVQYNGKTIDFPYSFLTEGVKNLPEEIRVVADKTPGYTNGKIVTNTKSTSKVVVFETRRGETAPNLKMLVNGKEIKREASKAQERQLSQEFKNGTYISIIEIVIPIQQNQLNHVVVQYGQDSEMFDIDCSENPELYILAIAPKYGRNNLKHNTNDAKDFINAVKNQEKKCIFSKIHYEGQFIDSINGDVIRGAFEALSLRKIRPIDYVMIFYSGHGIMFNGDTSFYLVPATYDRNLKLKSTFVNYSALIKDYIDKIDAKKVFFIDACHAGAAKDVAEPSSEAINNAIANANKSSTGTAIFSSSQANQRSQEIDSLKNGAYTVALLEAIEGKISHAPYNKYEEWYKDGLLNIENLQRFLNQRTDDIVRHYLPGTNQNPTFKNIGKSQIDSKATLFCKIKTE